MHYSLTRATLWNLAGYLYLIVASLIATPILVQSLGLAVFAKYSLVVAALALVSSLDLGLPQAVVRALARTRAQASRETLWATSSLLFIFTGLLAGLLAATTAYYLHIRYDALPVIFALVLMNNLVSHYATLPQAEGHFGYFNAKTFIVGTANTLVAAFLASVGQGISVILSSQLLFYLFTLLPLVYFSLKFFPHPWLGKPSWSIAKSLLTFGLKNQAGKIVGQVQAQYSKYLLVSLSPLSLSAYVIAQGLVQKLAGAVVQLASAIYPATTRSNITQVYYRLQLGLFGCGLLGILAFYLFGMPFLIWWLHNPELIVIVNSILRVLTLYFAVLILTPLASIVLDGHGRPELTSLFAFITTSMEITLSLLLFPRYVLFAPVYASIIAVTLTTPVLLYITHRVLQSRS